MLACSLSGRVPVSPDHGRSLVSPPRTHEHRAVECWGAWDRLLQADNYNSHTILPPLCLRVTPISSPLVVEIEGCRPSASPLCSSPLPPPPSPPLQVGHQVVGAYAACMGVPLFRRRMRGCSRSREMQYSETEGDEVEDLALLLAYVKEAMPQVRGGRGEGGLLALLMAYVKRPWRRWESQEGAGGREGGGRNRAGAEERGSPRGGDRAGAAALRGGGGT